MENPHVRDAQQRYSRNGELNKNTKVKGMCTNCLHIQLFEVISNLSSATALSFIIIKTTDTVRAGIATKYQRWKLADKVTQLAITRLFQSARQFIFSANASFRNSSLTH